LSAAGTLVRDAVGAHATDETGGVSGW